MTAAFDRSATVKRRLAKGQQFNAYELAYEIAHHPEAMRFGIGIGPITDFLQLATTGSARMANTLVDALRAAADQPPCTAPLDEGDA